MKKKAYALAGVDVDLGNRVKAGLGAKLKSTGRPEVLGKVGGFGGLFSAKFPGYKNPVLVASIDGVGTKLKLAFMTGKHDTVGADLVNHCINDILTLGAEPLFFLDYIGAGKLEPKIFNALIKGMTSACAASNCALIGGETAQMPGFYAPGEYDLAGTIVGVVDKGAMVDGSTVAVGDIIVGLPSDGLHTNGYSLARQIVFDKMKLKPTDLFPASRRTVAAEFLRVHRCYLADIVRLRQAVKVKGMAHITGGGLVDNLPRVLPKGCDALIDLESWEVPDLFQVLCGEGRLPDDEAYQVFNMGIGFTVVVSPKELQKTLALTKGVIIGRIVKGRGKVRLVREG